MSTIKTPIIPSRQHFVQVEGDKELDKEAICIFVATGFFLDTDTYWKNQKVLAPASQNLVDESGILIESKPWFQWQYNQRDITFEKALEEFTSLFEQIIAEQLQDNKVILPLSGGLDSRTQAIAISKLKNSVTSYSYSFKGGYPESNIAKKIAKSCGFDFKEFKIEAGYLWPNLEELVAINNCYSEFTHPRQMAVLEDFKKMEGVFSLGHWGDVLFDRGAPEGIASEQLMPMILKKVVKKGGMELAQALWDEWSLDGDFDSYLKDRIATLLNKIDIQNTSAKFRAFKSMYWAPRWTSINLSVFEAAHPISLPYYDDRMCQFICTVPEEFLADRRLQIAYIKQQNPQLAKITWEAQKPFNLYTFEKNITPHNLPYRAGNKLNRTIKEAIGKPYVQRNWELQFLGMENDEKLQDHLFSENLHPFISKPLIAKFYNHFKNVDAVKYSHPLSMLLTLAVWNKNRKNG
ncbi:asparagine synthase [Aequorivita soesokkakensis]|uniref:asparagine synthase (glutamine-hydrolyzing) n=1 Tax=Aequorivita soesokkakensis TaxID=1385699 RepID=A0A1A9LD55_9FLAO|nr:asparagine synthase-related protein [Aequorivita soesokkakensis]OAD91210.1 asparagine synthase [Aequorivita soesokkakensis]